VTTTLKQPTIWLVDGPILLLYVAAAALVFLVREANDRILSSSPKEAPMSPLVIALLALVSNLLCVASLAALANALSSATRLSMLALPLFLLIERYGARLYRRPRDRSAAAAPGGALLGLAAGARLFMRRSATAEPLARVKVAGDVRTVPFTQLLRNEGSWGIGLKLAVIYGISLTIFFGLHALLKRAAPRLLDCPPERRGRRAALATALAFALNFAGVAVLILAAKSSDVQTRLAMVGFPLFLIAESYTKLLRAEPQNRPSHWTGLVGSSGGMIVAAYFLLRGAPLH
jgi:hypothetical protein